ncbi:MAG: MFS transporter [Chloroflexi bacterium]|nr:MFS transporter [Chloroflexota bacterium]
MRAPSLVENTFRSMRFRSFRLFVLGSFFEHSGEFMEMTTLSWLMWKETQSEVYLGLLLFCRIIPLAVFPLIGGVVADRVNRKAVLIAALVFAALISASLLALVAVDSLAPGYILAAALGMGLATSFNHPARSSIVPNLVPRDQLMNAISLDTTAVFSSMILGPVMAGQVLAMWGPEPVFAIRVVGVAIAIMWLLMAHIPATPPHARAEAVLRNLVGGIGYLRDNRLVMGLLVLFFVPTVFVGSVNALLPTFADEVLGSGERGLGYLQGAGGAGSVIAMLTLASLRSVRQKGLVLLGAGMAMGLSILAFAASPWLALSLVVQVVTGAVNAAFNTTNMTLTQSLIPDEVRGRVMSLREMTMGLGSPVGSLSVGALAGGIGAPQAVAIYGSLCFLISLGLFLFLTPVRRIQVA